MDIPWDHSQPDWKDDHSISILGEPRLGFWLPPEMDSMVNHYTVSQKATFHRCLYTGRVMGKRPDYTITYCNLIRHHYKKTPIIIGGIEARSAPGLPTMITGQIP